jgi:hypothetical protein
MKKNALILLVVSCLLQACTSFDSIETSGNAAAIPPFRTFAIHEEQFAFAVPVTEAQRASISASMRRAAVEALQERGYREASTPDVLVTLGAISRVTFDDDSTAGRSGGLQPVDTSVLDTNRGTQPPPEAAQPLAGVGREGDLILYLLDPSTKRTIWRANASGSASTPAEAERKARSTYRAMVRKLPEAEKTKPD